MKQLIDNRSETVLNFWMNTGLLYNWSVGYRNNYVINIKEIFKDKNNWLEKIIESWRLDNALDPKNIRQT